MKIPAYSPTIRRAEMDAVLNCMVAEKVGPGEINKKLIQYMRDNAGTDGCAALRSPALALYYALQALEIEKGSIIMVSALAPAWQAIALERFGYEPLALDTVEGYTATSVEAAEAGVRRGARALVLHETLGCMPDMDALSSIGIPIVEDISQSFGAKWGEKSAGSFGVFSLLGLEEQDIVTAGGGALLTACSRREGLALRRIAEDAPSVDLLPDFNAALALVQLKEFARNQGLCAEVNELYTRSLMRGGHKPAPQLDGGARALYSFPVVLSGGMKDVKQYAARKDVDVRAAFERSIAAVYAEKLNDCPHAESMALRCALFPLYARLGKNNAIKVSKVLATLP